MKKILQVSELFNGKWFRGVSYALLYEYFETETHIHKHARMHARAHTHLQQYKLKWKNNYNIESRIQLQKPSHRDFSYVFFHIKLDFVHVGNWRINVQLKIPS